MPEHRANQIEALPVRHGGGRKTMAQVVNSYVREPRVQANPLPRLLDPGEVGAIAISRKDKLACTARVGWPERNNATTRRRPTDRASIRYVMPFHARIFYDG